MFRLTKLLNELVAADLPVVGVSAVGAMVDGLASEVRIDWEGTPNAAQLAQAATIREAHDPVDYEALETEEDRGELRAQAAEVLADFQQALDNWATLTAAQQKAVLKRCVQVNVALIKLLRHIV